MTESVSDTGRGDVLSQVRNLVTAVPRDEPQPQPTPKPAGRLLLTPALRVPEPQSSAVREPLKKPRRLTLEERIAELEAAVGGQADEWEPDGSEDMTPHRPDAVLLRPAPVQPADAEAEDHKESARPDNMVFLHAEAASPAEDTSSDAAAEMELPDSGPADGFALTDAIFQRYSPQATAPASETETDTESADTAERVTAADASDAAPEAAHVEVSLDAPEPGDVIGAPIFSRRMVDLSKADAAAEPVEAPEPPAEDVAALAAMDDARLEAMVRKVLLEELSGPLGEKMTSKIRVMLRREVERALSLRAFD